MLSTPRVRLGRLARLAGATLLAASALGSAPAGAAAKERPLPPPRDLTFYGRGWGHGVGMSQYGARGRALAGQTTAQILAHYYAGTSLGQRSPTTVVRVLVMTGFAATAAKPAIVTGRGGTWTIDGQAGTFPADARLTLAPTSTGATTWTLKVIASTGGLLKTATVSSAVVVRPASSASFLELTSKASTANQYRGYLRIRLTTTVMVVNHVGLDLYLRGVVPAEMPSSWPAEALKAQSIAARSYAVNHLHPSTGTYDVYDDTRSQVYRGRRGEAAAANAAIAATAGSVLLRGTAVANALFHSSDGGWTENNENVFVSSTGAIVAGPVSYLRGSSDRAPDGTSYDAASPYATWHTATYTWSALSAIFGKDARTNAGALSAIDLSRRGVSGRLISVTLTGSLGTKVVSGGVFVSVFNAGRPAADPAMRGTLFATAPIP